MCLCLWHCCGLILLPPARLQPPSGPLSPPFLSFPILHLRLALSGSASPHLPSLFLHWSFHLPFCLFTLPQSPSLSLYPLSSYHPFHPSAADLVRSHTQYGIDWFSSVFSDLAVIVPERSRQIDFSEKDTVMFGNLWLHRAN